MIKVLFVIALAALCGGSVPPFAKIALEVFQPFTLVMIRFLFATLVLIPFVQRSGELNVSSFRKLFATVAIGALNPILLFIALQFTKASVAPLIYAVVPSMTAIYLAVVKKKRIVGAQIIGIVVGFVGVAIIILLPLIESQRGDFQGLKGNALIFIAAIAFLVYGLMSKKKQQDLKVTPIALTFYFSLITLLVSIPFSIAEISRESIVFSQIGLRHIFASLELGIVGTSIFYLAYQYALKLSSELTAALFTYLQPVVTVFFAVLLLGEIITTPFIIGGALAIIGAQRALRK